MATHGSRYARVRYLSLDSALTEHERDCVVAALDYAMRGKTPDEIVDILFGAPRNYQALVRARDKLEALRTEVRRRG